LDFKYVREHPESIFWQAFSDSRYSEDFLDFLPAEAVRQQVNYIKEEYRKTDEETERWWKNRPGIYLTEAEMDLFVETASNRLFGIYNFLRSHPDTSGCSSVLELI